MQKIILLLIAFFTCQISYSGIYKWKDENGNIQYSDVKPKNIKVEAITIAPYQQANIVDINQRVKESDESKKTAYLKKPEKVVMYSTQWCGYCKKARKYFKENNIAYKEYDIEKNQLAKRRYKKLGGTGVPVILVGKKRINGFNEKKFNAIYQ